MKTMKVPDFLRDILKRRLHLCSDRILEFETRYGMSFAEFKAGWEAGEIPK